MRHSRLMPLFFGLTASALVLAADGPTLSTPLTWKPTSILSESAEKLNLTPFANRKVAFLPLVDKRKEKDLLGENREKAFSRFVTTPDAVAPFVSMQLVNLLKESGLPITDKAEGANIVVSGELLKFNVLEKDTYQGEFRALLEAHSGEKLLWKGMAVGRATRFGRSYKLENYQEVLSDCLVEGAARLLTDSLFISVLAGQTMVVPIPAAN